MESSNWTTPALVLVPSSALASSLPILRTRNAAVVIIVVDIVVDIVVIVFAVTQHTRYGAAIVVVFHAAVVVTGIVAGLTLIAHRRNLAASNNPGAAALVCFPSLRASPMQHFVSGIRCATPAYPVVRCYCCCCRRRCWYCKPSDGRIQCGYYVLQPLPSYHTMYVYTSTRYRSIC